jgi:predicted phosphoribosyltransferase
MLFRDRVDAGQKLAAGLRTYRQAPATIVLGIPRGGLIVGQALARELDLPLGVCPVRKIGAPENPELAVGAVDDEGETVVDDGLLRRLGVMPMALETEAVYQRLELQRWMERVAPPPWSADQYAQVILTDDGIATGLTARAGMAALRRRGVRRLILAVPVAPQDTIEDLRSLADECVCLATPSPFYAVGNFYQDWPQVTDEEVIAALRRRSSRN